MVNIKVNPQAAPQITFVGKDKTPVIIIDDYISNLDEIISQVVKNAQFKGEEVTKYPGVRSSIPKPIVVSYLKPLMKTLYKVYKFSQDLQPTPIDNCFSLITQQPDELSAMQSWPHFDTPNPNLIAVLHYLDKGNHGGTAFFQHNKSGIDRVDDQNKDLYFKHAHDYFSVLNTNSFNYCTEAHSEFTCYQKIAYKPNRLLIFPGQLLHSTLVDLETDINGNPETGRLTANMFVSFK